MEVRGGMASLEGGGGVQGQRLKMHSPNNRLHQRTSTQNDEPIAERNGSRALEGTHSVHARSSQHCTIDSTQVGQASPKVSAYLELDCTVRAIRKIAHQPARAIRYHQVVGDAACVKCFLLFVYCNKITTSKS